MTKPLTWKQMACTGGTIHVTTTAVGVFIITGNGWFIKNQEYDFKIAKNVEDAKLQVQNYYEKEMRNLNGNIVKAAVPFIS